MSVDEARVLSPAVVAEDLAALADVLPFDERTRRLLDRAAELAEQLDHAREREAAVRTVCRDRWSLGHNGRREVDVDDVFAALGSSEEDVVDETVAPSREAIGQAIATALDCAGLKIELWQETPTGYDDVEHPSARLARTLDAAGLIDWSAFTETRQEANAAPDDDTLGTLTGHCCSMMRDQSTLDCEQHHDHPIDCPDVLVLHGPQGPGLPIRDGGSSWVAIRYCPWCATDLCAREVAGTPAAEPAPDESDVLIDPDAPPVEDYRTWQRYTVRPEPDPEQFERIINWALFGTTDGDLVESDAELPVGALQQLIREKAVPELLRALAGVGAPTEPTDLVEQAVNNARLADVDIDSAEWRTVLLLVARGAVSADDAVAAYRDVITEPADAARCKACGRPFSPSHDTTAPGPTARHPFQPAEPADGHSATAELESIADILFDAGTTDTLLDLVPRLRALADRLAGRPWPADDTQETTP